MDVYPNTIGVKLQKLLTGGVIQQLSGAYTRTIPVNVSVIKCPISYKKNNRIIKQKPAEILK